MIKEWPQTRWSEDTNASNASVGIEQGAWIFLLIVFVGVVVTNRSRVWPEIGQVGVGHVAVQNSVRTNRLQYFVADFAYSCGDYAVK